MSIRFDRVAEIYDDTRGFPPGAEKGAAEAIARAGKFDGSQRILEIGVGTGRIALPTAPFTRAYVGVDISLPMMHRLRHKQSGERVFIAQADATRLPFPAATFDAAVAVHVFHLIPDWQGALTELARVLRPNGLLLHCVTENDGPLDVGKILSTAFPSMDVHRVVGVRSETFLEESGWERVDEQVYAYAVPYRPIDLAHHERNRTSSRTWTLSDEEVEARANVIEQAVRALFADPTQLVDVPHRFRVKVYRK